MITYEFPINERIRTLLRLEDLYCRLEYLLEETHPNQHHAALLTLFELMEATSRADLKSDLLQELERQRKGMQQLKNHPHIAEEALNQLLGDIDLAYNQLFKMTGKVGQHLRDNEWLMLIKQRAVIPGGTSRFDLPSYYYWQKQPVHLRQKDLKSWYMPFLPIKAGLDILMNLLRHSAKSETYEATHGQFQQMSGGKPTQLLRLSLDEKLPFVPELSANRYAINIRFTSPNTKGERPITANQNITFVLAYCALT